MPTGAPTRDPAQADMLLPLGGADFGYKGAGLAGLVTLLSAVLTGGTLDHEMRPMFRTDDFHSPRNLGHFCLAIDPDRFVGRAAYDDAMARYLAALRAMPARAGERVLAPGDREWETEAAAPAHRHPDRSRDGDVPRSGHGRRADRRGVSRGVTNARGPSGVPPLRRDVDQRRRAGAHRVQCRAGAPAAGRPGRSTFSP